MVAAAAAGGTASAHALRVDDDAVAGADALDILSDGVDDTSCFVPGDEGRLPEDMGSRECREVRTADTCRRDTDDDILGPGGRFGQRHDLCLPVGFETYSAHGSPR